MARFMIEQVEHHFILFSLVFLFIGYILGYQFKNNSKEILEQKQESFFTQQDKTKTSQAKTKKSSIIDIDESTHVVKIKTDSLEKKYENISEEKQTQENISESVNKLKSLKK